MWDEHAELAIDAAIDQASRELTSGAPGSNLRARVIAKLDGAAASSSRRRLLWAAPVAVAALLIVAFGIGRRGPALRVPAAAPQAARVERGHDAAGRIAAAETGAVGVRPPAFDGTTAASAPSHHAPKTRRGSQAAASTIDALAPAPLMVGSIGVPALGPLDSIQLSEMTVPSIDVAPLTIDDRPK
jgi:hypothetical protein